MKITNERGTSGSIVNNRQNLERYVMLQTVLFHFNDITIQEGILEEQLVTHGFLLLLQYPGSVLTGMFKGPSLCQITEGFNL